MEWIDVLRVLTLIGLVAGAWQSWKAMPRAIRVDGRRYYRQPDGSFRPLVGRCVRDPALLEKLNALHAGRDNGPA